MYVGNNIYGRAMLISFFYSTKPLLASRPLIINHNCEAKSGSVGSELNGLEVSLCELVSCSDQIEKTWQATNQGMLPLTITSKEGTAAPAAVGVG
jgi:hypothetical protein